LVEIEELDNPDWRTAAMTMILGKGMFLLDYCQGLDYEWVEGAFVCIERLFAFVEVWSFNLFAYY